ncbi:MAG: hypothetical protein ACK498_04935 [Cyclobacteriaceae bacterium]
MEKPEISTAPLFAMRVDLLAVVMVTDGHPFDLYRTASVIA